MASVNKVILVGNLGKDPEIRATQAGKEIANLTVATSESWKDKNTGEKREKTEWHRVVIFNENLVNVCKKYLNKGSKLYLEGQLQTRKWTDQAGVEKYSTEIVLQNFGGTLVMLDGPKRQEATPAAEQQQSAPPPRRAPADLDDEIPFVFILGLLGAAAGLLTQFPGVV